MDIPSNAEALLNNDPSRLEGWALIREALNPWSETHRTASRLLRTVPEGAQAPLGELPLAADVRLPLRETDFFRVAFQERVKGAVQAWRARYARAGVQRKTGAINFTFPDLTAEQRIHAMQRRAERALLKGKTEMLLRREKVIVCAEWILPHLRSNDTLKDNAVRDAVGLFVNDPDFKFLWSQDAAEDALAEQQEKDLERWLVRWESRIQGWFSEDDDER